MIVISGALVLVSLVLLLVGLLQPELNFVYASIAFSLGAFVFLTVGVLQRRREVLPGAPKVDLKKPEVLAAPEVPTEPADPAQQAEGLTGSTGVATAEPVLGNDVAIVPAPAPAEVREEVVGPVLVVSGRPRYHVEGCRYLVGKEATVVAVADVRADGYIACGVCKPDEALGGDGPAAESPVAPRRGGFTQTPATQTPATRAPATRAPATPAAPRAVPLKPATAAAAPPAPYAPADATQRGSVVVIPDRNKYHTADCRYVRGADGVQVLTKVAATRAGYDACGVCKP